MGQSADASLNRRKLARNRLASSAESPQAQCGWRLYVIWYTCGRSRTSSVCIHTVLRNCGFSSRLASSTELPQAHYEMAPNVVYVRALQNELRVRRRTAGSYLATNSAYSHGRRCTTPFRVGTPFISLHPSLRPWMRDFRKDRQ